MLRTLAALALAATLAACGGGSSDDNSDTGPAKAIPTLPDCRSRGPYEISSVRDHLPHRRGRRRHGGRLGLEAVDLTEGTPTPSTAAQAQEEAAPKGTKKKPAAKKAKAKKATAAKAAEEQTDDDAGDAGVERAAVPPEDQEGQAH